MILMMMITMIAIMMIVMMNKDDNDNYIDNDNDNDDNDNNNDNEMINWLHFLKLRTERSTIKKKSYCVKFSLQLEISQPFWLWLILLLSLLTSSLFGGKGGDHLCILTCKYLITATELGWPVNQILRR